MVLSWRRKSSRRAGKENIRGGELTIPSDFRCPISLDLMKDPVTMSTGITYDRQSIETWIESGNATCPTTNRVLRTLDPIPNHTIRKMIQDWCVQNKSFGVERIPTPRIPISSSEAVEFLAKISASAENLDAGACRETVGKLKSAVRESDRNKRCVANSGAALVLASAFDVFSGENPGRFDDVLDETLSLLNLICPVIDEEVKRKLSSEKCLRCMVRFLDAGQLSRRRNSVLVVKQLVSSVSLLDIDGAIEALVRMVKEPICPTSTKASLAAIYHIARASEKAQERLAEIGLVSVCVEMLVDSDKSVCDKALGVLDCVVQCPKGRAEAYRHGLAIPVLVKKILRVSDLSTEFSISVLWKLCKSDERDETAIQAIVEALQVGAFQKLLLVLQVGCGERVKEKTSELLKVLNLHRAKVECIDSMDFKDLKRPF